MDLIQICSMWQADLEEQGGTGCTKGIMAIDRDAAGKAHQYKELGTAYWSFEPGNGTAYALILHKTDQHGPGVSNRWGGELLVAMPEQMNGGRAGCMALMPIYTPDFIHDQFHLRIGDAIPIAIGLSLFGWHVLGEV